MSCPTCRLTDGALNTDWYRENGSCVFGCGRIIPSAEDGMCPHCKDHSANEIECPDCGAQYADWNHGTWEPVP